MKALSEILAAIDALPVEGDRIRNLRATPAPYEKPLKLLLKYIYDPSVKFVLPEGPMEYENLKYDNPGVLLAEISRMYLFVEGNAPGVRPEKLRTIFTNMLSMMIPSDAELLLAAKDKRLPYKNINKRVVKRAWPDLL
jgi:hypothetical protein